MRAFIRAFGLFGQQTRRIVEVIGVLLEVRHLGLAHSLLELALKLSRQSPNFSHPVADIAQYAGQFFRPDRDQGHHRYQNKLGPSSGQRTSTATWRRLETRSQSH